MRFIDRLKLCWGILRRPRETLAELHLDWEADRELAEEKYNQQRSWFSEARRAWLQNEREPRPDEFLPHWSHGRDWSP